MASAVDSRLAYARPSPGCVQRSASSRIRSRYSAVNWRRSGLATTSGSEGRSGAAGPGGLVATLLDPQGRNGNLIQCHRVSLCGHRFSPPPPYRNSKGCWCLSDVGREGSTVSTMNRAPGLRARSAMSRSRRSSAALWRRRRRMARVGACAQWPALWAMRLRPFTGFGKPSACSRIAQRRSSCHRTRCLWRRCETSSGSI